MAKRLQGKVALITGGASGIGESTARLFARHGAKVIVADIQDELGRSVCEEIGSVSGQIISYVHCDVTIESEIENAVNTAVSMHEKLDIIFNNAGIAGKVYPEVTSAESEDFKRVFDVNVHGAFLGAKHAARVMIPEKKGSILFTASSSAVTYGDMPHAYTSTKHAIVGLTKNLAVELGKHGIRVNCISPFGIPTPLSAGALGVEDPKDVEEILSGISNLKGAVLDANDVAEAALYLGSDGSKYVSGLNLVIDGGYSLTNLGSVRNW